MKRPGNQASAQPQNTSKIERTILLMFTLGGFGGGTSLCVAEALIDAPSDGDAAPPCSSTLEGNAIGWSYMS